MIEIRKAWWTTAILAAFTGCNSEEPMGANPPPPPPPSATPSTTPDFSKSAVPKPDETKDAAPKEEPAKDATKDEGPKIEAPKVAPPAKDEPAKEEAPKKEASTVKLKDKEIAAIKELSADEQVIALKQIVCPVSGHHLGSMGKPFKVSAEGKTFMLCCDGCDEELKTNPKAVLAKLGNPK